MRYDWLKQNRTPVVLVLSLGVLVAFYSVLAAMASMFPMRRFPPTKFWLEARPEMGYPRSRTQNY